MRNLVFIIAFIFSLNINASSITQLKRPTTFDSLDVILSLKNYTEENKTVVKNALLAMHGVNYVAYCDNHNVFLIYIDKTIYTTSEQFFEIFIKNNDLVAITCLKNGLINGIISFCDFKDSTDAETYKLSH